MRIDKATWFYSINTLYQYRRDFAEGPCASCISVQRWPHCREFWRMIIHRWLKVNSCDQNLNLSVRTCYSLYCVIVVINHEYAKYIHAHLSIMYIMSTNSGKRYPSPLLCLTASYSSLKSLLIFCIYTGASIPSRRDHGRALHRPIFSVDRVWTM